MTTLDRLFIKLRPDSDGCWIWHGAQVSGYGTVNLGGRTVRAHRLIYEEMIEPIPEGFEVHHSCHKKLCCNPRHLFAMSRAEHRRQNHCAKSLPKYCPNGHAYDDVNIRLDPRGHRRCQICEKANYARHYRNRKPFIRAEHKAYYEKNKEKIQAYNRAYYREWRKRQKQTPPDPPSP